MTSKTGSKSRVALVACESYEIGAVRRALRTGIGLVGGVERFVKAGEKILLKPNVLFGMSPEKCIGTHPMVFRAVGEVFKEAGAELTAGDSPGIGGCVLNFRMAGLKAIADELGIRLADFSHGRVVRHPRAILNRRFVIARGVLEAEGLISLPKLKTHALVRFTGAIKNQFGCIPGFEKKYHHARMPDPYDFGTMLVDLNTLLRPRLYIMDGIMGMEGNGPRGGRPRKLGVLIISDDPVAVDAVACRIIDLDPEIVPTSRPGETSGLGTYHRGKIEVLGGNIDEFICRDFDVVRQPLPREKGGLWRNVIKNRTGARPAIDAKLCTRCGICIKACPVEPKAVDWADGDESVPPQHDYNRCIRCFCCQEVCPEGAIYSKESILGKIIR